MIKILFRTLCNFVSYFLVVTQGSETRQNINWKFRMLQDIVPKEGVYNKLFTNMA